MGGDRPPPEPSTGVIRDGLKLRMLSSCRKSFVIRRATLSEWGRPGDGSGTGPATARLEPVGIR